MKKYFIAVALLFVCVPAFAWDCNYWHQSTNPNAECYVPPTTGGGSNTNTNNNTNSNTNKLHQNQNQWQAQQQKQNQHQSQSNYSSNENNNSARATGGNASSRSSATGGSVGNTSSNSGGNRLNNKSSSRSSADNSGGNSATSVDTSDHSTSVNNARSNVFIPGDLPNNSFTVSPAAYITTTVDDKCGPVQEILERDIYQWDRRHKHQDKVGTEQYLGKSLGYLPVPGGRYAQGMQGIYVLSTSGSSNTAQLGLQGGGGGGYGGVSYGSGSAQSGARTNIIGRACYIEIAPPAPVVTRVYVTRPMHRHAHHYAAPCASAVNYCKK